MGLLTFYDILGTYSCGCVCRYVCYAGSPVRASISAECFGHSLALCHHPLYVGCFYCCICTSCFE
ncbi:hypothetical protein HanRHA438_Chr13g0580921 [Helianthus annuus]|nr:hypothetical protein HanRHA438_Chr13g0580921 [Helianthus annuus]